MPSTPKIIVTAASRHGATAEIGEAIADELATAGAAAAFVHPEDVVSLLAYDAIVLGSAVYAGRWLEPARRLTDDHHAVLRGRPLWLFSSGPIGDPLAPTEEPADGRRLLAELGAREHRVFPGRLNTDDLGWVERTITGFVKAPNGDFRNWDEIRAWARSIAAAVGVTQVPA
jgi:menaquinone-dependent protoporphyrinogen oxidase